MLKKRVVGGFIVVDNRSDFKFSLKSGKTVGTRADTREEAVKHIVSCLQLQEDELQEAA